MRWVAMITAEMVVTLSSTSINVVVVLDDRGVDDVDIGDVDAVEITEPDWVPRHVNLPGTQWVPADRQRIETNTPATPTHEGDQCRSINRA